MRALKYFLLLCILGLSGLVALLIASDKTPSSIALGIGIMAIALNLVLIRTAPDYDFHFGTRESGRQSFWKAIRSYTQAHPVRGGIAQALLSISVVSIPVAHFL
jgi:hypothetical protein